MSSKIILDMSCGLPQVNIQVLFSGKNKNCLLLRYLLISEFRIPRIKNKNEPCFGKTTDTLLSLRKHAFYNQKKKKKKKFQIKNSDIFHISAQNIDCGYLLELPRPQSMFFF